jgi:hypothetical protein
MVMQLCYGWLGNNSRWLYCRKTKQSWRASGHNTYPSRLGFSYDWENTTATSIFNPSVVEVSTAGFLPQEASLSVQPMVEVKHSRFYCYDSESGNSDKSICSSGLFFPRLLPGVVPARGEDPEARWRFSYAFVQFLYFTRCPSLSAG